jgi:hypothetical protein
VSLIFQLNHSSTSHPIRNDLPQVLEKFSLEKCLPLARFELSILGFKDAITCAGQAIFLKQKVSKSFKMLKKKNLKISSTLKSTKINPSLLLHT